MEIFSLVFNWMRLSFEFIFPSEIDIDELKKYLDNNKRVCIDKEKGVIFFWRYKDETVRQAIWQMKYKKNEELIKYFAKAVYGYLNERLKSDKLNNEKIILISIPSSEKKINEKGFNQIELLCREISRRNVGGFKADFEYAENFLKKIRHTKSQASTSSRKERLENLRGAFILNNSYDASTIIYGNILVIIDDVYTTGTTMKEVCGVLKKADPKEIYCVALAH